MELFVLLTKDKYDEETVVGIFTEEKLKEVIIERNNISDSFKKYEVDKYPLYKKVTKVLVNGERKLLLYGEVNIEILEEQERIEGGF